jgi:signal peptidase I
LLGKEPWLAVILSMFLPGIGQIYSGNVLRGWIFILSQILLLCLEVWLVISLPGNITDNTKLGSILLLISVLVYIYVWSLFDAHKCARKANNARFE